MIEKMDDFFTVRVEGYDNHMLNNVAGCKTGYAKMAELVPNSTQSLLDLGCGTGLELEAIFQKIPDLEVTGIDLTQAMLDVLQQKYSGRNITLIQGSYFDWDFGSEKFDVVISFQTMHHFSRALKLKLYKKIYATLKPGGQYIECDYMVMEQREEDFYQEENIRIRAEQGIAEGEFYHYDMPFTISNQIQILQMAEFESVQQVWREENTTIIASKKQNREHLNVN